MMSALRRISSARSVTSRRFPIGVATTYNVRGSALNASASRADPASPTPAMRAPFRFDLTMSRTLRRALVGVVLPSAEAPRAAPPGTLIAPYDFEPRIVELPPVDTSTAPEEPQRTLPPTDAAGAPASDVDDPLPPPATSKVV